MVIDVQEKLFGLMQDKALVAKRIELLMNGAQALGVPIIVTEQYVKGLGHTIPTVSAAAKHDVIEKTTFSCFGEQRFVDKLRATERTALVLCGIEAHICVMQTALDGIDHGYDVVAVEDAVSARLAHTARLGLKRMSQSGTRTATAEGQIFEWLGRCDRSEFKDLLPLFKESR